MGDSTGPQGTGVLMALVRGQKEKAKSTSVLVSRIMVGEGCLAADLLSLGLAFARK
jgi:hypothetical protein